MYTFVVIIHVFACLFLILIVLIQTGRSGGFGGIFGGSGAEQLFSTPSGSA
ncbi:MAG: preprotein translocase subunit SecG, partial [Endomicrobiia bacterium]